MSLSVVSNGKTTVKSMFAHRIVATVFHGPAPSKDMVVDHINKKRSDNAYTNLRWVTPQENITFAIGRPVVQSTKDGTEVGKYNSLTLAAQSVNRDPPAIWQAIKSGGTSAGYRWAYEA